MKQQLILNVCQFSVGRRCLCMKASILQVAAFVRSQKATSQPAWFIFQWCINLDRLKKLKLFCKEGKKPIPQGFTALVVLSWMWWSLSPSLSLQYWITHISNKCRLDDLEYSSFSSNFQIFFMWDYWKAFARNKVPKHHGWSSVDKILMNRNWHADILMDRQLWCQ